MSFFKNLFGSTEAKDLTAFANGTIVPIENVPDPVFAEKTMGEGFAILPEDGKIYSPADGTIFSVYPTGHAICMEDNEGRQLLLHMGLETAALNGDGFRLSVQEGSKVKAGDLLVEMDQDFIKSKGLNDITILVLTNSNDFSAPTLLKTGDVKVGEPVFHTEKN